MHIKDINYIKMAYIPLQLNMRIYQYGTSTNTYMYTPFEHAFQTIKNKE